MALRKDGSSKRSASYMPYDSSNSFVKKIANKVTGLVGWRSQSQSSVISQNYDNLSNSTDDDTVSPTPKRIRMQNEEEDTLLRLIPSTSKGTNELCSPIQPINNIKASSTINRNQCFVASTPADILSSTSAQPNPKHQVQDSNETESTDNNEFVVNSSFTMPQFNVHQRHNVTVPAISTDMSRQLSNSDSNRRSGSYSISNSHKPSFNVDAFSNSSRRLSMSVSENRNVNSLSPFYSARTLYGGASALLPYGSSSLNKLRSASTSKLNLFSPRSQITIQPVSPSPNNCYNDQETMSASARKILDTLEKYCSPVMDAKRIPVSELRRPSGNVTTPKGTKRKLPSLNQMTPSTADLLRIKRQEKMQDSVSSARQVISSVSEKKIAAEDSDSSSDSVDLDYSILTSDASTQNSQKYIGKTRRKDEKAFDHSPLPPLKLPNAVLKITNLPKFDITDTFTFSKPLLLENIEQMLADEDSQTLQTLSTKSSDSESTPFGQSTSAQSSDERVTNVMSTAASPPQSSLKQQSSEEKVTNVMSKATSPQFSQKPQSKDERVTNVMSTATSPQFSVKPASPLKKDVLSKSSPMKITAPSVVTTSSPFTTNSPLATPTLNVPKPLKSVWSFGTPVKDTTESVVKVDEPMKPTTISFGFDKVDSASTSEVTNKTESPVSKPTTEIQLVPSFGIIPSKVESIKENDDSKSSKLFSSANNLNAVPSQQPQQTLSNSVFGAFGGAKLDSQTTKNSTFNSTPSFSFGSNSSSVPPAPVGQQQSTSGGFSFNGPKTDDTNISKDRPVTTLSSVFGCPTNTSFTTNSTLATPTLNVQKPSTNMWNFGTTVKDTTDSVKKVEEPMKPSVTFGFAKVDNASTSNVINKTDSPAASKPTNEIQQLPSFGIIPSKVEAISANDDSKSSKLFPSANNSIAVPSQQPQPTLSNSVFGAFGGAKLEAQTTNNPTFTASPVFSFGSNSTPSVQPAAVSQPPATGGFSFNGSKTDDTNTSKFRRSTDMNSIFGRPANTSFTTNNTLAPVTNSTLAPVNPPQFTNGHFTTNTALPGSTQFNFSSPTTNDRTEPMDCPFLSSTPSLKDYNMFGNPPQPSSQTTNTVKKPGGFYFPAPNQFGSQPVNNFGGFGNTATENQDQNNLNANAAPSSSPFVFGSANLSVPSRFNFTGGNALPTFSAQPSAINNIPSKGLPQRKIKKAVRRTTK